MFHNDIDRVFIMVRQIDLRILRLRPQLRSIPRRERFTIAQNIQNVQLLFHILQYSLRAIITAYSQSVRYDHLVSFLLGDHHRRYVKRAATSIDDEKVDGMLLGVESGVQSRGDSLCY